MTRVPLGPNGAISNRAPIIEARYCIVRKPFALRGGVL
jgi:hypothetical protein